jgi:hypothetical protein
VLGRPGFSAQEKDKPKGPPAEAGKAQAEPRPPAKWEYKIIKYKREDEGTEGDLNKLGEGGWELVGAAAGKGGTTTELMGRLILKRPKK